MALEGREVVEASQALSLLVLEVPFEEACSTSSIPPPPPALDTRPKGTKGGGRDLPRMN